VTHHADLTWAPDVGDRELEAGVVFEADDVRVIAAATDHPPVEPTLAYRFEHDGRAIVLAGDTLPCPGLDELLVGADVYVQTVLRDDLVRLVPMQRFVDTIDYHSTVEQAAVTAARAGVGTLVLTHQIPTPAPGGAEEWVALARAHFDGDIVFGEDLTEV
jgi:ribonuclease Z